MPPTAHDPCAPGGRQDFWSVAGAPEDTASAAPEPETDFPAATSTDPRILIRDTNLRVTPSAILRVSELLGQLVRLQDAPAGLDGPSSYEIRVERAVTTMTGPGLAALMNDHVFAYEDAPLTICCSIRRSSFRRPPSAGAPSR